jgi:hypothetical protein
MYDFFREPVLRRYFPDNDPYVGLGQILEFLETKELVEFGPKPRPGRPRKKEYSQQEKVRAYRYLINGLDGNRPRKNIDRFGPTARRYESILDGLDRPNPRDPRFQYKLVKENLFQLFHQVLGVPNGCTQTMFADSHRLPRKLAKEYVRFLVQKDLARFAMIHGRKIIKAL